jgi:hypothetical protein
MTKDEFIKKYGDCRVKFKSYYKYQFVLSGESHDGKAVVITVGGNADDIYRLDIMPDEEHFVGILDPISGRVYKGDDVYCEFYDY